MVVADNGFTAIPRTRRAFAGWRVRLLVTVMLFSFGAHAAFADAMFRGDAAHLGVYASEPANPPVHSVRWRFHTGGHVVASPSIAGGIVYIGSGDGMLYALRAVDGSVLWKFKTGAAVNSTAAVAYGRVYVSSLDGNVYAIGARTGKLMWHFTTGGERRYTSAGLAVPPTQIVPDAYDVFLSSPAVADGTVFLGSGDQNVYALDAATGKKRWSFHTGGVVHASPAVADGAVFIGSFDRYLYKLDERTGALRWRFATERRGGLPSMAGIPGSAAVVDGAVFFGARDAYMYAVDAASGRLRWKHDMAGSWVVATPAVTDGGVYVTTSDALIFAAFDAGSGKLRWSVPYDMYSFSSPAISAGHAYFGTFDGRLYDVDLHAATDRVVFASPLLAKNRSKALDTKGHARGDLYGDGTFEATIIGVDRLFDLGSILSSPVVSDGVIYFGSTDGDVYALA